MPSQAISRLLGAGPLAAGFGAGGSQIAPPPPIPGFYGDGSAGDVVLGPGVTGLIGPVYARSFTVPVGSTLRQNGFPVFATQFVRVAGLVDVSGFDAVGGVHGAGQGRGLNGGDGTIAMAGGDSAASTDFRGGRGGDGGPGTSGAGGTAVGTQFPPIRQSTLALASPADGGGGGGAGGGDLVFPGGGGGGGGGYSIFVAPQIIVEATGVIDVSGGNGAASPGGTAGAGGGGGGGLIYLISPSIVLVPGSVLDVLAGLAGGAGAVDGNDGFYIPLTA